MGLKYSGASTRMASAGNSTSVPSKSRMPSMKATAAIESVENRSRTKLESVATPSVFIVAILNRSLTSKMVVP